MIIKHNDRASLDHARINQLRLKKKRKKPSRVVFHRLFQSHEEGQGANDPFIDDSTDEDTRFPSNISPRDQFPDTPTGTF